MKVHVLLGQVDYGDQKLIGVYENEESAKEAKERLENSDVSPGTIPSEKTALPDDHDWGDNLVGEYDGMDHPITYSGYFIVEEKVRS